MVENSTIIQILFGVCAILIIISMMKVRIQNKGLAPSRYYSSMIISYIVSILYTSFLETQQSEIINPVQASILGLAFYTFHAMMASFTIDKVQGIETSISLYIVYSIPIGFSLYIGIYPVYNLLVAGIFAIGLNLVFTCILFASISKRVKLMNQNKEFYRELDRSFWNAYLFTYILIICYIFAIALSNYKDLIQFIMIIGQGITATLLWRGLLRSK